MKTFGLLLDWGWILLILKHGDFIEEFYWSDMCFDVRGPVSFKVIACPVYGTDAAQIATTERPEDPCPWSGRGPTGLRAWVRNRGWLENRGHVVPKTEFQDGGDRTRIFTHKIIILA